MDGWLAVLGGKASVHPLDGRGDEFLEERRSLVIQPGIDP